MSAALTPYYTNDAVTLYAGDCLDVLPTLPDNSVDAVCTDPPYGLEFMGKQWDTLSGQHWRKDRSPDTTGRGSWFGDNHDSPRYGGKPQEQQAWHYAWAAECLRVLKPGGHLLAFGGTRTWHRLAVAIEDAGFEIRDTIAWLYGSGFPKSLSVHKASLTAVESRYAEARCDCLDPRNGRLAGQGAGREGGDSVRNTGAERQVSESPSAGPDVQVIQGAGDLALRELRNTSGEEGSGHHALAEALLFPSVRIGRTEAARHGHAAVRPGLEEHPSEGATAGQGVRSVQDATGRDGAAYPSPEAVPLRGNESSTESREPVRLVPSHGGSDHDGHAGSDPDRRFPRGIGLDDQGRRRAAVARVCSWCGLPDPDWLSSLEGLGTAAKPAHEPIVVARKPLVGTVAANVLAHGTGALNVDGCRIGTGGGTKGSGAGPRGAIYDQRPDSPDSGLNGTFGEVVPGLGRWPANVALDETAAAALDHMSGETVSQPHSRGELPDFRRSQYGSTTPDRIDGSDSVRGHGDSGGASRFFYTAKAGSDERITHDGIAHPTVKPLSLLRWLVRLVTPPGGVILEPFAGSGTTVEAALLEGFRCIAIEREPDYLPLITQRINRRRDPVAYLTAAGEDLGLFDEDAS